jgi:hypothetical protein
MGLIERSALKRCQTQITPYAEEGEEAVEFDIGQVGSMKVDLVATDRALYITPRDWSDVRRLPFENIGAVLWMQVGDSRNSDWVLGVKLVPNAAGEVVQTLVEIRAPTGLGKYVEDRVAG